MLSGNELRQKYLDFFAARGHKIIPSASLIPQNDSTTLFTSAGMQPMMSYLLGQVHPFGTRLVNSQKCFRSQDIEEVGDNRHTTFFEMLGNWSFGDYFKKEQITWFFTFLTKELGLPKEKLAVSVFEGNDQIPRDEESAQIWKELGIPEERILYYGVEKNWWSRSGVPDKMPAGEPGGPDSEVFFEFTNMNHDSKFGEECHPNCDCGRFLELGNSVFMKYKKETDGSFTDLPKNNIDFGGGLERLAAAVNDDPDIFKTDLFFPIIKTLEQITGQSYVDNAPAMRIIADHLKGAVMLITEDLQPGNKQQGYVLRRLLRRAALKLNQLKPNFTSPDLDQIVESIFISYEGVYLDRQRDLVRVSQVVIAEVERFQRTLAKGLRELEKHPLIDGKIAFDLLATYGFPHELTLEIAAEKGQPVDREQFESEFRKHQETSRSAAAGMFKGGLADQSETVTKYHTATHLLQQALRDVLGDEVHQAGSNLTSERLRFDFTYDRALTLDQLAKVEQIMNEKIAANLPQELCGGPHLTVTGEIGKIKIVKQESLGSSLRRVYLKLAS